MNFQFLKLQQNTTDGNEHSNETHMYTQKHDKRMTPNEEEKMKHR